MPLVLIGKNKLINTKHIILMQVLSGYVEIRLSTGGSLTYPVDTDEHRSVQTMLNIAEFNRGQYK